MGRIRVLFVAPFGAMRDGGTGGMASVANNFLRSHLREEFDIMVMDVGLPTSATHNSFGTRAWFAIRRMARYPRQLASTDVLLVFVSDGTSWLEKGALVLLARWMKRGVVLRPGGAYYDQQCARSGMFRRWVGLVLRCAHVVCSQGARWTAFFHTFPGVGGKVVEICNPIQLPELGKRRKSPGDPFTILHVGWMIPRKGIFEALQVFERVKAIHPEAQFTLAGGGELFEEFLARAAPLGDSVHALGWVPKERVPALLDEADVFLAPARAEGMPNSVLEAMAHAVPVVATRVGALPNVINHGENGFLADVDDLDAMTEAVLQIAHDAQHARQIGLSGRTTIERRHGVARNAGLLGKALQRAAIEVGRYQRNDLATATSLESSQPVDFDNSQEVERSS